MKKILALLFMCGNLQLIGAPTWLNDQDDQTDIYAIPLDSSEEEEKQEEKQLQPKPVPPRTPTPSGPVKK